MLKDVVIVGGCRTPVGGFSGTLAGVSAAQLGALAIKTAVARSGVAAAAVQEVIFGNVLGAGLGQNVARQCTLGAGLAPSVGATTVNKVCGSSLKAVMLAAQGIQSGDVDVVVAGGTENMSAAPYILSKARTGYRMGNGELIDVMINDGLWDVYSNQHMGKLGDRCATHCGFTRDAQDQFAVESYQGALKAVADGRFKSEIVPVEVKGKKGPEVVDQDEGPARFNEAKMRSLKPAFAADGTVTAGNASSINDGAAAVVVMSGDKARALNLKPIARILGYSTFSREPEWFTLAPVGAVQTLLSRLNLSPGRVDLYEINEAFAVVPMVVMKELGIPRDKVNVNGGAIALGHPIGASGARTLVTLLGALAQRQARTGVVSLCIGGGEAVAMAVELC
jgi:acetyl-CoA C-acetyltransferase